jgi:hypothetical protein
MRVDVIKIEQSFSPTSQQLKNCELPIILLKSRFLIHFYIKISSNNYKTCHNTIIYHLQNKIIPSTHLNIKFNICLQINNSYWKLSKKKKPNKNKFSMYSQNQPRNSKSLIKSFSRCCIKGKWVDSISCVWIYFLVFFPFYKQMNLSWKNI